MTPVLQVHPDGLHISGLMDSLEPWIALEFLAETESAVSFLLRVVPKCRSTYFGRLESGKTWKKMEQMIKRLRLRQMISSESRDSNEFLTDLEPSIELQT